MRKIFGLSLFIGAVGLFFVQAVSTKELQGYRGFVVTSSRYIPDARCTLVELEHTASRAQVMHIQNDDPENFFALCFRTHPTKSHGVAHIVEHTVLQGSQKFPINNVFFHMNKRSFATFMNALTGPDYTCYPASSQCPDDFYNLLSIYSDAAFHPLLKKSAFAQEGHRLEFETFDDPTTPLMYKGVVYNEMKGSLTSPQVRMMRASNAALFPDSAGDVFSGGDPAIIPELTHEEFVQFHKDHYYPGNCLFYFYGNLPLEGHLDFLADNVLKNEQKRPPIPERPLQPYFTEPKYVEVPYPVLHAKPDQAIVGINWLTKAMPDDCFALRVLDFMLTGSDAAPLKHELLHSGLCKEVDSGVDVHKRPCPYLLYIEGCAPERAKEIEELVLASLARIAHEGIAQEMVDRTLARLELEERDLRKGKGPVGLSLLHSCAVSKLHGAPSDSGLTLSCQLKALQEHLKQNPSFFASLIQKHFIDNPHRVCVVLIPSSELAKQEIEQERQKLDQIKAGLSQEDIASIILVAKELREQQNQPVDEALACLPTVTLDSVEYDVPHFALQQDSFEALELFYHPIFTNHITYASLEFGLPELQEDELWQASLYAQLLPQLGNSIRSYRDNLNFINEHTGGISADFAIHKAPSGPHAVFKISGKALDRKAITLLDLIYDTITAANFADRERIRQLVIKHANEVDAALNNSALEVATLASLASQSIENRLQNSWGGLEYCIKVKELVHNLDTQLDPLIAKLQSLQKRLLPSSKAHLVLACDEEAYKALQAANFGKLSRLYPEPQITGWNHSSFSLAKATHSAYHLASSVAFNARGFCTVSYTHPDSAYLLLAAELVSSKFLHTRIREQGGAYGAGAKYDPASGNFCFCTYRDPNIASSNQAFAEAIALLAEGNFTEDDVQKAKLGILQRIDAPLHPAQKAFIGYEFLCENRGVDDRKNFRHKLLTASSSDIQRAAGEHLPCGFNQSVLLTLASKDLVEQENKKLLMPLLSYEVSQCK